MKKRYRDLTEKYKTCRLQPEPIFLSRIIQTFFNKFTKKGKKAVARRHLLRGLSQLRLTYQRPRTFNALLRVFRSLYVPLLLVNKRKGKTIESVPVPVRRNKRESICLTTIYSAVKVRRERALYERIQQEFLALTAGTTQSTTMRQISTMKRKQ